ncbi:hypothetical protein VNO77_12412 [Canavalia gladiata]|uniref:Uncharacterized protein n=1 Tax=Canavalia gladiata TaxID=3824 RepID=A0AAN9QPQ8_CANGL
MQCDGYIIDSSFLGTNLARLYNVCSSNRQSGYCGICMLQLLREDVLLLRVKTVLLFPSKQRPELKWLSPIPKKLLGRFPRGLASSLFRDGLVERP